MDAFLILEDGQVFKGKSFGAKKEVIDLHLYFQQTSLCLQFEMTVLR